MNFYKAGALALNFIAVLFRIMGIIMCALTCVLCFGRLSIMLTIPALNVSVYSIALEISCVVPKAIAGYGVISTPMGGVFRVDFALCAAVLFLLDYLFMRLACALRKKIG